MTDYGLNERVEALAAPYAGKHIGRVMRHSRGQYTLMTDAGETPAVVAGRLLRNADPMLLPTVGDFVMADLTETTLARVEAVLPRSSLFARHMPFQLYASQPVAANIDVVMLCMSLNLNYNLRRLERYLALALESGALPVVVLTKADLAPDAGEKLDEVSRLARDVQVVVTSSQDPGSLEALRAHLGPGRTLAFLGSSGVGKSTLINLLAGEELLVTREIGNEDEGRHTTTHRELILLPGGGLVMDTPGMRELGMEEADLEGAFADIAGLAEQCRFRDCSHQQEPDCAVRAAVEQGLLDKKRLRNYRTLQQEKQTYLGAKKDAAKRRAAGRKRSL